jgi:capsular polysaccharide biosynthesis protein
MSTLKEARGMEKIASRMGFDVVDVIGMSWEDQVNLFSTAKVVVGAGGAVMANYIFLPRGAKVISLTSEYLSDFSLPAYLASVAGASFTYITGKPRLTRDSRRNTQQLMHSGFRIKKSTFRRVLESSSV